MDTSINVRRVLQFERHRKHGLKNAFHRFRDETLQVNFSNRNSERIPRSLLQGSSIPLM
jgi:hypothetical protein